MKNKTFIADFETSTPAWLEFDKEARVWAYSICDINTPDNVIIGNNIDDFMKWCENCGNNIVMFHNLKFDSQYILSWLFKNGFEHIHNDHLYTKTFSTLISDKGLFYQIEIMFERKKNKVKKVIIQDSYKLVPLPVKKIAQSFKLPISKLELDYDLYRPIGYKLTNDELEYIKNDVKIVAYVVKYFKDQGLNKMTIGSCALAEYKDIINKKNFERFFPIPKYDQDVRNSYRGGFTYLNPKFSEKTIKNGVVFDVNSLYPSVMYYEYLPFGTPIFFEGEYKEDTLYPLYIQTIRCQFEIKKGKIPTIQIKRSGFKCFAENEYLTSSNDLEIVLCLTNIDLKLFKENYDIYNLEYMSGWKFKATRGLFTDYIDKWSNNKIKAKKEHNAGLYQLSKLFLNSLYGKFGSGTKIISKIPYMGDDGIIHYTTSEEETKDGVYIAMASFITSYARNKTIRSAQKITDDYNSGKSKIEFVYADTDSLHCKSDNFELPELDIDDTRLGAWKFESKFNKAKFLRQKCYIENSTEDVENDKPEYEMKITVAGMPGDCHEFVTFENFKIGAYYKGKLQPKRVPGGVILDSVDFTIKKV